MDEVSASAYPPPRQRLRTILVAGFVAGIFDGVAASIQFYAMTGKSPIRVFQYIASALMGPSAFSGGQKTAALGALLHLVIAIGFAAIFYSLYPLLRRVLKTPIVMGAVYGVFVWLVMNFLVVPLTKAARGPFVIKNAIIGMTILIVMVGIPISIIVSRNRKVAF